MGSWYDKEIAEKTMMVSIALQFFPESLSPPKAKRSTVYVVYGLLFFLPYSAVHAKESKLHPGDMGSEICGTRVV